MTPRGHLRRLRLATPGDPPPLSHDAKMPQRRHRRRRRIFAVTYRVDSVQDELAAEDGQLYSGQQEEPAGQGFPAETAQHERHGDAERPRCCRRRRCQQLRRDHDPMLRARGHLPARLKRQSAESSYGGSQRSRLRRYATAKLLGPVAGVLSSSDHRSDTSAESSYYGGRILSGLDTTGVERGSIS